MMKNRHYHMWNINPQDFYKNETQEDKLKFILRFGLLAPSSHNTQPWRFKIEQNTIHIYRDISRHLKYSDPTNRLVFISLGAVAENIAIAADYYELKATEKIDDNKKKDPAYAFSMYIDKSNNQRYPKEFLKAILNRASYRKQYKREEVSKDILQSIADIKEDNASVLLLTEQKDKDMLAEYAGIGMKDKMSSKSFRMELASWLRNNLSKKPDGMPGFGHELSMIISIVAPYIIRAINVSSKEREKIIGRVQKFPAICVITSDKDTEKDWIAVGRVLERAYITLTAQEVGVSIIAAPIESNEAREKLYSMINKDRLPQIVFGFGLQISSAPHSPRRSLSEVLKKTG